MGLKSLGSTKGKVFADADNVFKKNSSRKWSDDSEKSALIDLYGGLR